MDSVMFKYFENGDALIPLLDRDTPHLQPCRFEWYPEVLCAAGHKATGRWQYAPRPIPWEHNIQQVVVQSRKAYQLFCNEEIPEGRCPYVIIKPPRKPEITGEIHKDIKCLIVCRWEDDYRIACGLMKKDVEAVTINHAPTIDMISRSDIVVFPFASSDELSYLAVAQARQCKIVASDAGAHEEWLCHYATPGRWFVVPQWDADKYFDAIKILSGGHVERFGAGNKDESIF